MYYALDIAKYIVTKCTRDNKKITNIQLQKILHCIQAEYTENGKHLFADAEYKCAYGYYIPSVYYKFCGFGAMPIHMEYDGISIDAMDRAVIDRVVEEKRTLKPWEFIVE